jgi:hypothetical protein
MNLPVPTRTHEMLYGSLITKVELVKEKSQFRIGGGERATDESFVLYFEDGARIVITDDGQSCCESRYMTTDDDIQSLVGNRLVNITGKEVSDKTVLVKQDDWGDHETVFVEIQSSGGFITLVNHNEHNGYYGGFSMTIRVYEAGHNPVPAF